MAEKPTYAELEQTVKKLENEAAKRERAEKTLDIQRCEFISVFDRINEPIYICDPDTHELLYANAATIALFGPDLIGQKCHLAFQGLDEPCDFCTKSVVHELNQPSYGWYAEQADRLRAWHKREDSQGAPGSDHARKMQAESLADLVRMFEKLKKLPPPKV